MSELSAFLFAAGVLSTLLALRVWLWWFEGSYIPESTFDTQYPRVFVEIIPREIADIVSDATTVRVVAGGEQDTIGYESVGDAICDAKHVGFRTLSYVASENLFFFFGERTQDLQDSLFALSKEKDIAYNADNIFRPLHDQHSGACQDDKSDPVAVVLCKLNNMKLLEDAIREHQQSATKQHNCYQMSWRELQELNHLVNRRHFEKVGA